MTLEVIKAEIEKLTAAERATLAAWLQAQEDQAWDEQITADYRAGKLGDLIRQAEKEFDDGTIREAP